MSAVELEATPSARMVELKAAAIEGGVQRLVLLGLERQQVAWAAKKTVAETASAMAEAMAVMLVLR